MLNKAIKELMNLQGLNQKLLCVAMGQSESTFSRMFMKDNSAPKTTSLALLARRMNIKVSDIYLEMERLVPVTYRFFYSKLQKDLAAEVNETDVSPTYVYIDEKWVEFTEKTDTLSSSEFVKDVLYLGEAPEWHTKQDGRVHCPALHEKLCSEIVKQSKPALPKNKVGDSHLQQDLLGE